MPLNLCAHVFVVEIDGDIVFMDTDDDSYLAISRSQATSLDDLLKGDAPDLAANLIEIGLLTAMPVAGGPSKMLPVPRRDLVACWPTARASSGFDTLKLAPAAVSTVIRLRCQKPRTWFRARSRRRARANISEAEVIASAARLPHLLLYIPFIRRCLPRCLFGLALLDRDGVPATWVFGVRTHPFEAHCWLQWNDIVLDDRLDHVRRFTPIFHV